MLREPLSRIDTGMIEGEPLNLPFRDHRTLEGSHQLIYIPQSISTTLRTFRSFSMVVPPATPIEKQE
jgi:hypothetical protein